MLVLRALRGGRFTATSFVAVAAIPLAVGIAATVAPTLGALRVAPVTALRVDPVTALRYE